MYQGTEALVLKSFDTRETDAIITIFSRDLGKVSVVVKGVKKPQSSLRGMVQPFCRSHFYLTRSGEMYLMTQGKIISFYGNIREDLTKTLQAVYILELLDKSLVDNDPNQGLYRMTTEVLGFLDENEAPGLVVRYFELKLLGMLGFAPELNQCSNCGQENGLGYFSRSSGGVLCTSCESVSDARPIKPGVLAVLRSLQKHRLTFLPRLRISNDLEAQVEKVLEEYLEYYLDRRFNLKKVIRTMKGLGD